MTITSTRSTSKRTLRSLALVLAAATATVTAVGVGLTPTSAQADPGDTRVTIGSSQLVQSEDLSSIQLPFDTERVVLNRDNAFSSCLGEGTTWTQAVKGSPKPIAATWTRSGHRDQALYQLIAQGKDAAQAQTFAATLVRVGIKDCQQPTYDFHYGPVTTERVGAGTASWALSYRGASSTPDGGVVVVRKGSNVGFVQLSGRFGPADQTMESVAKVATSRLVYSS